MHPLLNFEFLYIKFEEDFLKFAFFQKLALKLKNMIYYFNRLSGLSLKMSYILLKKIDKTFKKNKV